MANQGTQQETGDPGRTPGSAEGDRETVEQDLRDKQGMEQHKNPPEEGIDTTQQQRGDIRKEDGHAINQQDDWINKRI